jgi:hypothetical protein
VQQSGINEQMTQQAQAIQELVPYLRNNHATGTPTPASAPTPVAGADQDGGIDGTDKEQEKNLSERLKAVIDPETLERAPNFTGKDEDFNHWEFALTGYFGLIGIHDVVEDSMKISVKQEEKLEAAASPEMVVHSSPAGYL